MIVDPIESQGEAKGVVTLVKGHHLRKSNFRDNTKDKKTYMEPTRNSIIKEKINSVKPNKEHRCSHRYVFVLLFIWYDEKDGSYEKKSDGYTF